MQRDRRGWRSLMTCLLICCAAVGCDRGDYPDQGQDVDNEPGDGPAVVFDPLARPLPQVPFPNDILTRPDAASPTGLRLDLPVEADTEFESDMRRRLNRLDGFGTAAALSVAFDAPLNLESIRPDALLLLNIDPDSPDYGGRALLDVGLDQYPMVLEEPVALFPLDEDNDLLDLVFAPGNRKVYYEDETDTLILKPLYPLLPATRYAVVLTRRLRGGDDEPIRAPEGFEHVYFPQQRATALEAIRLCSERHGIDAHDVAFVWTFTTQSVGDELEAIRDGLDNSGPLARLAAEFPAQIATIDHLSVETDGDGNPFILRAEALQSAFDALLSWSEDIPGLPIDFPYSFWADFEYIDYFTGGTFVTPNFLDSDEGIFSVDPRSGAAQYGSEIVPFMIAVPKPCEANGWAQPPYPVVLFQHGNERNRDDMVLVSNVFAKHGFATISMDAAGHGPETTVGYIDKYLRAGLDDPEGSSGKLAGLLMRWWLNKFYPSIPTAGLTLDELYAAVMEQTLIGAMNKGRATDTDGDGVRDSGEEFFTADVFLTRDMVRQTVVDQMLFLRIAQGLGRDLNDNGLLDLIEGDFNLDGVLDLGGPDNPVYYVGTSMGGILGSVFLGVENRVSSGVVNVPGGMMTDLVVRSSLASVATRVFYEILGPRIVGQIDPFDPQRTLLTWNNATILKAFDTLNVEPGWEIVLINQANGLRDQFTVTENRGFQVGAAADIGDPLSLLIYDQGRLVERREYVAPYRGLHLQRNTPELRNFLGYAQVGLDSGDPINYAPLWNLRPLQGNQPKNVLVQVALGDWTVPAGTGVAVARAGGVASFERCLQLARLGVMLGWRKDTPFAALNEPFESTSGSGFRIHPAGNHAYLYWPTAWVPEQAAYTFAVKEQISIYLETDGQVIEDDMNALLADYPGIEVPGN